MTRLGIHIDMGRYNLMFASQTMGLEAICYASLLFEIPRRFFIFIVLSLKFAKNLWSTLALCFNFSCPRPSIMWSL